jgi:hypothetical protein
MGFDPRIHLLAKIMMDCRVKPGNDNRFNMAGNRCRSLLCSFVSTGSQGAYYDRKIKGKY